jgi:hypothetical protein
MKKLKSVLSEQEKTAAAKNAAYLKRSEEYRKLTLHPDVANFLRKRSESKRLLATQKSLPEAMENELTRLSSRIRNELLTLSQISKELTVLKTALDAENATVLATRSEIKARTEEFANARNAQLALVECGIRAVTGHAIVQSVVGDFGGRVSVLADPEIRMHLQSHSSQAKILFSDSSGRFSWKPSAVSEK